jgi:hypothetical protein
MVFAPDKPVVVVRPRAFRALLLSTLLFSTAAGAAVQDLTRQLATCAAVPDAMQRLACYDSLVRAQSPAPPAPQLGAEELPRAAAAPEENSVTATVAQLSLTPLGRFVLTLDNGQIWRQLDADTTGFVPSGSTESASVTISRGSLGSYNLQFVGHNALYKVRRVK